VAGLSLSLSQLQEEKTQPNKQTNLCVCVCVFFFGLCQKSLQSICSLFFPLLVRVCDAGEQKNREKCGGVVLCVCVCVSLLMWDTNANTHTRTKPHTHTYASPQHKTERGPPGLHTHTHRATNATWRPPNLYISSKNKQNQPKKKKSTLFATAHAHAIHWLPPSSFFFFPHLVEMRESLCLCVRVSSRTIYTLPSFSPYTDD
jgi:hypothetical protein